MAPPVPTCTPTSRLLIRLMDVSGGSSRRVATATTVAVLSTVIALDAFSDVRVSTHLLYVASYAFTIWCVGQRTGLVVCMMGAFAALVIDYSHAVRSLGHPLSSALDAWSVLSRALSLLLFTTVLAAVRKTLLLYRWRAAHDGLTGILNKAGFEEQATQVIARLQGKEADVLLVFVDLDGFKEVNDKFGHGAGDTVLRSFAALGSAAIRPTDLFARFGGDEFAALLIVPPDVDGRRIAELMHERFTAILAQTGFEVTCSMGATIKMGDDVSAATMIRAADELLYEVKRSGKNGLCLAPSRPLTRALRSAYPPCDCDDLNGLLRRIDLADKGRGWTLRSAA